MGLHHVSLKCFSKQSYSNPIRMLYLGIGSPDYNPALLWKFENEFEVARNAFDSCN